jgi:Putative beta-barrel porin-2, OmpL-like. bbp2
MAWKGLGCMAAVAVLGLASLSWAGSTKTGDATDSSAAAFAYPLYLDDTTAPAAAPAASAPSGPTTLTPIMYLLDPTSFGQWLEKNKFNVTGFVEGGYFLDTANPNPNTDQPTLIGFPGPYSDKVDLDQLDLTISKGLDSTKSWDWGFTFENGYGTDDAFTHSFGMLDNAPINDPQNQYDIIQANVELLVPLGTGLTLEAGKFLTFLSQEVINPTGNAFYTHSYNFTFGVPLTNTGVTGSYTFPKLLNGNDLTVTGGISEGWNQSIRDRNGSIDFIGQAKSSFTSTLSWVLNLEIGPQALPLPPHAPQNHSNYESNVEYILTDKFSSELTLVGDFLYSDFPNEGATGSAQWYGVCGYAGYTFSPNFTFNLRGEWYRDQGRFTTGTQANYFEATGGVQIHPFPNDNILQFLQVRPELREDVSDRRVYNFSHDGGLGDYSELTFAIDVIMQF